LVREDEIDILIEVNGFTIGHYFVEMASRCAPVQVSYLNYTSTCGIPAVDYIIGDDISCPPEDDTYFTEEIYRMPGCFFCFSYESEVIPYSEIPPCEINGYVTFGCFGSGAKFNHEIIALWSKLLVAVPNSILVLQNNELKPEEVRKYYVDLFKQYDIPQHRLKLLAGTDRIGILENYKSIDISLDTWPYCGGNTIAESLWCGVPVISLKGSRFSSAYGASLLTASGCANLVANTPEEYVQIAARLACDKTKLNYYRKNLRQLMYQYGFSNTKAFAAKMETAYVDMLNEKKCSYTISTKPSDKEQSGNILLSVILFGRNDNFRHDYLYRVETAINFFAETCKKLNALNIIEIIMVDSASEIPLSEALSLTPEAANVTKFLYVSSETISRRSPRKSFLYSALLANAGIRRAAGKYVFYTDTDCLMPLSSLQSLLTILKGGNQQLANPEEHIFNMTRYHIPRQLVKRKPSISEWERLMPIMGGCFRPDYLGANTFGGNSAGHVMSRNAWHKLRGFDEEMTGDWGWHDNALMLRMCQTYNWIDLATYGVYSFHMEHEKMAAYEHTTSKLWNPIIIHAAQAVNDHSWGLGDDPSVIYQSSLNFAKVPDISPHVPLSVYSAQCLDVFSVIQNKEIIDYLTSDVLTIINSSEFDVPIFLQDVLPIFVEYARNESPLNIMTFGEIHSFFLSAVVKTCPAIEMLLCQPWYPGENNDKDISSPAMFMWVLEQAAYKGHARIINGDLATSVERAYTFRPDTSMIEMAWINILSVRAEFEIICLLLLPKVAPGGMVVIVNIDDKIIARLTKLLQASQDKYRLELVNYDKSSAILFKLS